MGEKEISVSFEELNRMEVYCQHCHTGILYDAASTAFTPTRCPSCGKDLPYDMHTAIDSYRHFFHSALQSKQTFKFRVKEF
jgi:hypothetical protein